MAKREKKRRKWYTKKKTQKKNNWNLIKITIIIYICTKDIQYLSENANVTTW